MENNRTNNPRPFLEPLAVDLDGVRQLLGVSISETTIWRLEKQRRLLPSVTRQTVESAYENRNNREAAARQIASNFRPNFDPRQN